MARLVPLIAAVALCALPASASAAVSDFGSDLSSPANISLNHGSDTSYWNISLPFGSGPVVAPADGQVTIVKLKGGVLPNKQLSGTTAEDLAQIIHFQVLRDKGDGRLKVVQLSTGHQKIPVTDDPQRVTRYDPVNLCVKQGDIVAFNTIGAHEYRRIPYDNAYQGAEYQVFGRVPDSTIQWYEKDNGLNEGTTISPSPADQAQGVELLMRTTLATGPDATDICPGGYAQHVFKGLEFKDTPQPSVRTKLRIARMKGFCDFANYGGCIGTVALDAVLDGVQTHLGDGKFNVKPGYTVPIDVPLSPDVLLKIQQARKVTATATAQAHDNPRAEGASQWDSVPVQSVTSTDQVVLTPDKLPCVVPKIVGNSSKVAKAKLRKAGCATGKVKRKRSPKNSGKVIAQSVPAKTVLPAGAKIDITIGTH
jgi:hypothetical protein